MSKLVSIVVFLVVGSFFPSLSSISLAQSSPEPEAAALRLDLDWVTVVSAHGEIGYIQGRQRGVSVTGVYGPSGHVRGFVGHDVLREKGVRIVVGYDLSLGFGLDSITARPAAQVFLTRHAIGALLQLGGVTTSLMGGVAVMSAFEENVTLVGATIQAHPGASFGGFWLGFPIGVDIWPDLGIFATTIGISLGGTTL